MPPKSGPARPGSVLWPGPQSASAIAREIRLTPAAVTTLIDRLEKRGFVRRKADPNDRRKVMVEAAEAAQRLTAEVYLPLGAAGAKMLDKYSVADLAAVDQVLNDAMAIQDQAAADLLAVRGRRRRKAFAGRVSSTLPAKVTFLPLCRPDRRPLSGIDFNHGLAMNRVLVLAALVLSGTAAASAAPANFVYTSAGELAAAQTILERPDIAGAQVVYNWKRLEPSEGVYDFTPIEEDLARTDALGKKLFIQVQDRFFSPEARNIPPYLLDHPQYGGGLVQQIEEGKTQGYGWTAMQWRPEVRARYQALLAALAERFDGKVYGVNLPETAIDVTEDRAEAGFTCDAYFAAELDNLKAARAAFQHSTVVQYVNFWPCEWDNDHSYMSRLFDFAKANDIGLGGPDIVPFRKGQMKNSYPFFNANKGALRFVGMAVQEPTLAYVNEKTGKPFTKDEFVGFATDYLGVDAVFWSTQTPWLQ